MREVRKLRKHFPNFPRLGGILLSPTETELQTLKKKKGVDKFWIVNSEYHWTALVRKGNKWYEIDSFNRDLEGPEFENFDLPEKQKESESDCGQRTLAGIKLLFD